MAITLVSEATTGNGGNADSYTFSPGGRSVAPMGVMWLVSAMPPTWWLAMPMAVRIFSSTTR
ncbi:MAG: hypothetical protein H6888_03570 [Nitratireductor sp.]|nr:hypothetical protein [Nitratireductor sp.]